MITIPDFMIIMRMFANRKGECIMMQDVYYETGITYSHVTKLLKMLRQLRWLDMEKESRQNLIMVTPLGLEIANNIAILFGLMKIDYKDLKKKKGARNYEHFSDLTDKQEKKFDIEHNKKSKDMDYELEKLNKNMEKDLEVVG